MAEKVTKSARYVQLPELIEIFKRAPSFISNKAFKAIPLSKNGELMVETQITEHMAAGLATTALEVQEGQYALIHTDFAHKARPFIQDNGRIDPEDLLNNHIEVMDVCTEDFLNSEAIADGFVDDINTNFYMDPLLDVIVAREDMNIPSFMDPYGIEHIHQGQLLVRNKVLGVFPYERPHHSLTDDSTFLDHHLPVDGNNQLISLESSKAHQNIAHAVAASANKIATTSATAVST